MKFALKPQDELACFSFSHPLVNNSTVFEQTCSLLPPRLLLVTSARHASALTHDIEQEQI